jgi:hypothetical protein
VKAPSLGAVVFGLIPFVAVGFSVPLWDRIYPMLLGLLFNLFWLILWFFLTPLGMWAAYWFETRARAAPSSEETH